MKDEKGFSSKQTDICDCTVAFTTEKDTNFIEMSSIFNLIFCPQDLSKSPKSLWIFGTLIIVDLTTAHTLKLNRKMGKNVIHIFMGHFPREPHLFGITMEKIDGVLGILVEWQDFKSPHFCSLVLDPSPGTLT